MKAAFASWEAFLAMGKYGPFVWSAYGVALLILVISLVQPILRQRALRTALRGAARRAERQTSGNKPA